MFSRRQAESDPERFNWTMRFLRVFSNDNGDG
jgi:hypothetical protein